MRSIRFCSDHTIIQNPPIFSLFMFHWNSITFDPVISSVCVCVFVYFMLQNRFYLCKRYGILRNSNFRFHSEYLAHSDGFFLAAVSTHNHSDFGVCNFSICVIQNEERNWSESNERRRRSRSRKLEILQPYKWIIQLKPIPNDVRSMETFNWILIFHWNEMNNFAMNVLWLRQNLTRKQFH